MKRIFNIFSDKATQFTGSVWGFVTGIFIILAWFISGFFLHWSEMHSLFVNTLTTIITFLMVFLIQHSQNKDTRALHIKIDELIGATQDARNEIRGIESKTEDEINQLKKQQ